MQVSCSRKWLYALEKSDLQSIVQSVAEFHDRKLPEIEHVLFLPVSDASVLYQKNGARNPVHTGKFCGARNLRQKLASLNAASVHLAWYITTHTQTSVPLLLKRQTDRKIYRESSTERYYYYYLFFYGKLLLLLLVLLRVLLKCNKSNDFSRCLCSWSLQFLGTRELKPVPLPHVVQWR